MKSSAFTVLIAAAIAVPSLCEGIEFPRSPDASLRIEAPQIRESSGICASKKRDGLFWTHNDSGSGPVIYGIRSDGSLVATYRIRGAGSFDWEDIAVDQEGFIYIADVGNNRRDRRNLAVYKVKEPDDLTEEGVLQVTEKIAVEYPDGNYNCEALFIAENGDPVLITKDPGKPRVYGCEDGKWVFRQELETKGVVTGADMSTDGRLAVSTYVGFAIFERQDNGKWSGGNHTFAALGQCEAGCWNNGYLILTNEERGLFRFVIDRKNTAASLRKPPPNMVPIPPHIPASPVIEAMNIERFSRGAIFSM